MRRLLLLVLLTPLILWSEPVSIYIDYEGKKLKANAEWSVPEGVDPISVQREAWVAAGFPVLSPTLTLGINDRKEPYDCSYPLDHEYELNIKEIKEWIEWLRSKGVKRIVLAGHSMGGQQVIHTAEELKGNVAGVLAVAPAKGTPREHPLLRKAKKLVEGGERKKMLETNFFYCQKTRVSARTLYSYYGVDRNIGKSLEKIEIPVLIVWGGEDDRVRDLPKFLEPYVKGKENVRIEVIDYADHFFRDLASEDLSSIAIEFFQEVLK